MKRLYNIIEDAQVTALLTTHNLADHITKTLNGLNGFDDIEIVCTDINLEAIVFERPASHEIAFIQYTSGSTGIPKGAVISAANVIHNEQLIQNVFGCDWNSVILSWLPFHHDMELIQNT